MDQEIRVFVDSFTMPGWINPIALRKAKIVYNFGLSECSRVKNIQ